MDNLEITLNQREKLFSMNLDQDMNNELKHKRNIKLRKDKRFQLISKKRILPVIKSNNEIVDYSADRFEIEEIKRILESESLDSLLNALNSLKVQTSNINNEISQEIYAKFLLVPIIYLSTQHENLEIQTESAGIIANFSSSSHNIANNLIDSGVETVIISLLQSESPNNIEIALLVIGNLAADSHEYALIMFEKYFHMVIELTLNSNNSNIVKKGCIALINILLISQIAVISDSFIQALIKGLLIDDKLEDLPEIL